MMNTIDEFDEQEALREVREAVWERLEGYSREDVMEAKISRDMDLRGVVQCSDCGEEYPKNEECPKCPKQK